VHLLLIKTKEGPRHDPRERAATAWKGEGGTPREGGRPDKVSKHNNSSAAFNPRYVVYQAPVRQRGNRRAAAGAGMTRLVASPAARAAARKAGLKPADSPKTAVEAAETAPSPDDRRIHRHLLSLDPRLRWPGAFCEPPKPLAIGTGQALADLLIVPGREVEFDDLRGVLRWWCNRPDYLMAVARGEARVDLAGKPVALPSAAERERAAANLAALRGGQ
jgi:hypothetical protein